MTLKEYLEDYCDEDLKALGNQVITANIEKYLVKNACQYGFTS